MKSIKFILFISFCLSLLLQDLNAQVAIGHDSPQESSILDINVPDKGVLIPRVSLFTRGNQAPIVGEITSSLLVYNTNTALGEGFYYWSENKWTKLLSSDSESVSPPTNNAWYTANTTSPPASIHDRIWTNGSVGINIKNPSGPVHVYEPIGTSSSSSQGSLILEHGNKGGQSSIVFKSPSDPNSDFAYLQYEDNSSGDESTSTDGLLTIGIENDGNLSAQDNINIKASGSVGIANNKPNANASLDLGSANKGILINRVALTNLTSASPVASSSENLSESMLVYNTNTTIGKGFYYWNASKWNRLQNTSEERNIYNADGTLTGSRTINQGPHNLELSGTGGSTAFTIRRTQNENSSGIAFQNSGNHYDASIFHQPGINSSLILSAGGNASNVNDIKANLELKDNASLRLPEYGNNVNPFFGTPSRLLAVDGNGNVIEENISSYKENIYNTNGNLTSDRRINFNGHRLSFIDPNGRGLHLSQPADLSDINSPYVFFTNNSLIFRVDEQVKTIELKPDGNVKFGNYGRGTSRGNATYLLGVGSNGDVVEVPLSANAASTRQMELPMPNTGLQYYVYNLPPSSTPPDVLRIRNEELVSSAGKYDGKLSTKSSSPTLISDQNYQIKKFVGTYEVQNTGDFDFTSARDGGTRLYVDGVLVLDAWSTSNTSRTVELAKGNHSFEFWYYNKKGTPNFTFSWGANPDGKTGTINASDFTMD